MIVFVMVLSGRCEKDAARKAVQAADREGFRGAGADWRRDRRQQHRSAGRSDLAFLHADSTQLRPAATSDHLRQGHGAEKDGHANGNLSVLDVCVPVQCQTPQLSQQTKKNNGHAFMFFMSVFLSFCLFLS